MKKMQIIVCVLISLNFGQVKSFFGLFSSDPIMATVRQEAYKSFTNLSLENKILLVATAPASAMSDDKVGFSQVILVKDQLEKDEVVREEVLRKKRIKEEIKRAEQEIIRQVAPVAVDPMPVAVAVEEVTVSTIPEAILNQEPADNTQVEETSVVPTTLNNNVELETKNAPDIQSSPQQQPQILESSPTINIIFTKQQNLSLLRRYSLPAVLLIGTTGFMAMMYTFYRLKATEGIMLDKDSWMNWAIPGVRSPHGFNFSMPTSLRELKKSIFMHYDSVECLENSDKAIEAFCKDISKEIKSLQWYIKKAKVVENMHLRTLFGVALSMMELAAEKIKKLEEMRQAILEEVLTQKFERSVGKVK